MQQRHMAAITTRRILHLRTVVGKGGGPEKTLLNSHRYLPGYAVRLLYIHPAGDREFDLPQRAVAAGADLVAVAERTPLDPRPWLKISQEIRRFGPDVLHAHDYKTDVLAALFGRCFRIPVVGTLHGNVTRSRRLSTYYKVDRWALRRMRQVICVSRDLVDEAIQAGVPADRVSLIDNAIDLAKYRRTMSRVEAKHRLGVDPNVFLVGAVGRLMPEKGFDVLIRAMTRLQNLPQPLSLVIAGDGAEHVQLSSLIDRLKCNAIVQLLGHRTDVTEILQACDVFVLSSRREASPNVVLEAMALETPIIATRIAGVPDMINDDETGMLVEPENPAALADAVERLQKDPAKRARLATNARMVCETRYCFEARMKKEWNVYEEILGCSKKI